MNKWFIIILLCFSQLSQLDAQTIASGDFVLELQSDGSVGGKQQWGIHHGPSGNRMMGSAGVWVSAEDAGGRIYAAAHLRKQKSGTDFWAGPMDTFLIKAKNPKDWERVWFNDQVTIENHIFNWDRAGYQVPNDLEEWPANGSDNTLGFLAPFADANTNGVYEPEWGDYPFVHGSQSLYAIFNDEFDEHAVSKAAPLKCGFFSEFWVEDQIKNTFFGSYRLLNQSRLNYRNVIISIAADLDAGGTNDNRVAVDSLSGSIMLFNTDAIDDSFEMALPFVMITPLNFRPAGAMILDTIEHAAFPEKDVEFRNVQQSLWADGAPLSYGGNGRGNTNPTNYMYTWPEWKDTSEAGYRFGLLNKAPQDLKHGEFIELTFAISCGLMNRSGPEEFRSNVLTQLRPFVLSETITASSQRSLRCYPNPAQQGGKLFVVAENPLLHSEYKILDLNSRILMKGVLQDQQIRLTEKLEAGMYVLIIHSGHQQFVKKVLVK
jgi:hypothetical protein